MNKFYFLRCLLTSLLMFVGLNVWGEEVTYTIKSLTAVTTSGTAPAGSSVTYKSTYSSINQLTAGNSMTLTLSNCDRCRITGLTLSMRSNKSGGSGYLTMKAGTTTLATIGSEKIAATFKEFNPDGAYTTTYVNVPVTLTNSDYIIQEGEDLTIIVAATVNSLYVKSFTITYEESAIARTPSTTSFPKDSYAFRYGYDLISPAATVTAEGLEDAEVTYSSSNNNVATVDASTGVLTLKATGSATITATYSGDDTYVGSSASYSLKVISDSYIHDFLNIAVTGISDSFYSDFTGKQAADGSNAVYAGNSAGGNNAIQLRTSSNSGIITTTSGGKVRKVTVNWNTNTTSGRTVNVYGKNKAYSSVSDLFSTSASTQGTLLGTIVKGTSTSLTITGDYEYIGIRSAKDALYLNEIDIAWDYVVNISSAGYATLYIGTQVAIPDGLEAYIVTGYENNTLEMTQLTEGIIPAECGVILKGKAGSYVMPQVSGTVTEDLSSNLLHGSINASLTEVGEGYIYYKLANDSEKGVGFYWGAADGGAFTNGANKAYLALPASSSGVKINGFSLSDTDATAIKTIENSTIANKVYDLTGREVKNPRSGIYIINGKKMFIK